MPPARPRTAARPDHHATLGLKPGASPAEVKRAYRRLARRFHPDVSQEPDAEARFKQIALAYAALTDPPDEDAAAPPNAPTHDADQDAFNDTLDERFARHGRSRRGSAWPGEDQHAQLSLSLAELVRGGAHTVSLRVPVTDALGRSQLQARTLELQLPRGLLPGQRLRLAGQGGAAPGSGPAGDLFVEIALQPHPLFRLEGRDLHLRLPLAPWEAALGTTLELPTPGGVLSLTVPAGSQAGRRLRLKGRGLPGHPAGDLYAELAIALPPAPGTEAQPAAQAAWQGLAAAFPGFRPHAALRV